MIVIASKRRLMHKLSPNSTCLGVIIKTGVPVLGVFVLTFAWLLWLLTGVMSVVAPLPEANDVNNVNASWD